MAKPNILFLVFTFVIGNTFLIYPAFAVSSEGCNMFEITFDCDLSGWMKLILGDIAIAATLAIFLHYLVHRSNTKIEENSNAIKSNSVAIQKIITEQEGIRKRRKIYVIQSLKNHFSSLLLCVGIVNKFPDVSSNTLVERSKELESISQRIQNTLNLSIDVLDPMFVEQIEKFLTTVEQIAHNIQENKSWNYDSIKDNIAQMTKRLNKYSDTDDIIK